MTTWHEIYITDKTGKRGFVTHCTDWGLNSEKKNLQRHIDHAKDHPDMYKSWDIPSMRLVSPNDNEFDFTDDDEALLETLGI